MASVMWSDSCRWSVCITTLKITTCAIKLLPQVYYILQHNKQINTRCSICLDINVNRGWNILLPAHWYVLPSEQNWITQNHHRRGCGPLHRRSAVPLRWAPWLWVHGKDIPHLAAWGPRVSELAVLLCASRMQELSSQQNLFIIRHKESQLRKAN